jgi:hypothetical protein
MWDKMQIGGATIEFDAGKTRALYSAIAGSIANCECDCCANYRAEGIRFTRLSSWQF